MTNALACHAKIPGLKSRPLIGFIPEFINDPLGFLMELFMQFPEIAHFKLKNQNFYFINKPEYIQQVLMDYRTYAKIWGYDKFQPIFGKGLLLSNGELWKQQRKLAQPAFHHQQIRKFALMIAERCSRMLEDWKKYALSGQTFQLGEEIKGITMDVVSKTMFGTEASSQRQSINWAIDTLMGGTYERVFSLLGIVGEVLPTKKNRDFRKARQIMDKIIFSIIQQRRNKAPEEHDLLSMYMQTIDEESRQGMNNQQLRDEVMTIFAAGYETAAQSLSWIFYCLSKYPETQNRIRAEVLESLGDQAPTYEDLPQLKYTSMVVNEVLRLYPPSWIMARDVMEDVVLDQYKIKKGSIMVMSEYVLHRNPRYWENPEGFDPERFNEANSHQRPKFSYLPFGQGPRQCIGMNLALMEIKIILSMVLQHYHVFLSPGHKVELDPVMTLRPKHGVSVSIKNI